MHSWPCYCRLGTRTFIVLYSESFPVGRRQNVEKLPGRTGTAFPEFKNALWTALQNISGRQIRTRLQDFALYDLDIFRRDNPDYCRAPAVLGHADTDFAWLASVPFSETATDCTVSYSCSVESGDLKMLQFALSVGVRPSVDAGGRTALMQAARAGNRSATVYLLDHAVQLHLDPHAVDLVAGESALFYGVRSGSLAVVDVLLDHGRLRLTANAAGRDAVDSALGEAGPAASDVLRTLLDRFPDAVLRRRDDAGLTVLHRFVERAQLALLRRYAPDNYKPGSHSRQHTAF